MNNRCRNLPLSCRNLPLKAWQPSVAKLEGCLRGSAIERRLGATKTANSDRKTRELRPTGACQDLRCPFLYNPSVFPILVKRLPLAKPAPIRCVHLQQADRRSAYRSAPDNKDSVALEVLIPLVLPRMKQPDERAAFRVKSAQVRSLVCIAVVAGESEVSAVVSSAMLASDDVLDVIGEERLRILRQATVFAAITGPFADSLPEPLVHQAA